MRCVRWASPEQRREQLMLLSPSLDAMIPEGHPVRRLDALLERIDWTEWEEAYGGPAGRPPVHPRLMSGAILYGLTRQLRSTRQLEEATRVRIDFMWLLHGMTIDYSTFAGFRTRFEKQLPKLFRELALIALKGNMEVELAVDGTRIRANSSRTGSMTGEAIERRAQHIAQELSEALNAMEQLDLFEDIQEDSREALRKRVEALERKQAKLAKALEQATKRDAEKAKKNDNRRTKATRVPVTDSDSHVLANKEGGYAPNYTPTAAIDTKTGAIVAANVPEGNAEASVIAEAISETEELTGQKPERILFDSGFATGANLEHASEEGVVVYAPGGTPPDQNPAVRENPSEPVSSERLNELPTQGKKKKVFSREAFMYDAEGDCYWCPMGRRLPFHRTRKPDPARGRVAKTEYLSENCKDCPVADRCLSRKAKRRRISRDRFEPYREDLKERMATQEGRDAYQRRAPSAEGQFGYIKHVMGVRQFLLRGLRKVRMEWLWVCAAYNVARIIRSIHLHEQAQSAVAASQKPIATLWARSGDHSSIAGQLRLTPSFVARLQDSLPCCSCLAA